MSLSIQTNVAAEWALVGPGDKIAPGKMTVVDNLPVLRPKDIKLAGPPVVPVVPALQVKPSA